MGNLGDRARQAAREAADAEQSAAGQQARSRAQEQVAKKERMQAEVLDRLRAWAADLGIEYRVRRENYVPGYTEKPYSTGQGRNDSSEPPPYHPAIAGVSFTSDGVHFGAGLNEYGQFSVSLDYRHYNVVTWPIPHITSMADLGRALEELDDLRERRRDKVSRRAVQRLLPLIGPLSWLISRAVIYPVFWEMFLQSKRGEMSGPATAVLVCFFFGGVVAFLAVLYRTYEAMGSHEGRRGQIITGLLWAWAGVAVTIAMVANDFSRIRPR